MGGEISDHYSYDSFSALFIAQSTRHIIWCGATFPIKAYKHEDPLGLSKNELWFNLKLVVSDINLILTVQHQRKLLLKNV